MLFSQALVFFLAFSQAQDVRLSLAPAPRETISRAESGLVLLGGEIDTSGKVNHLEVAQGTAPFVERSLESVRQWKFNRAANDQTDLPLSVVLLFRARTDLPDRPHSLSVPLQPTIMNSSPQPETIVDPGYPFDADAEGTVILQMQIDEDGRVLKTDVIEGVPSLTEAAVDAVSEWTFEPAHHDGSPSGGVVVAVISFLRPALLR